MFHSSSGALLLPEGGAVTAMCTSQCCCLGDVYITFSAFSFAVMNGVGEWGNWGGGGEGTVSAYPGKITWLLSECVRVCGE